MADKWVNWDKWPANERRSMAARKPDDRDHDSKGVYAHRPKPPNVGRGNCGRYEPDRADDRDEENETDREDDEQDVERR